MARQSRNRGDLILRERQDEFRALRAASSYRLAEQMRNSTSSVLTRSTDPCISDQAVSFQNPIEELARLRRCGQLLKHGTGQDCNGTGGDCLHCIAGGEFVREHEFSRKFKSHYLLRATGSRSVEPHQTRADQSARVLLALLADEGRMTPHVEVLVPTGLEMSGNDRRCPHYIRRKCRRHSIFMRHDAWHNQVTESKSSLPAGWVKGVFRPRCFTPNWVESRR